MDPRFLVFAAALLAGTTVALSLVDGGAQCKIKWMFGIDCSEVNEKLVNQIQAWQIRQSCAEEKSEKCSYELVSGAPYLIKATHTSHTSKKVNNFQFLLEQSTTCKVTGDSVTAITNLLPAENSTNFCCMQNLMDGSKLTEAEGYKMFSNKWICEGFDYANCTMS
ncbi:uncharacterized protein wu:fc46h12 [Cololabis saira]|uniref:uncharacterized protein wu:fc46h12 n=1 Tax=Cololabis saira TaxID=129043 RepID=UPI002AD4B3AE|nr:uncharacterized protein wu:fc46h12 [Cololabis saira]